MSWLEQEIEEFRHTPEFETSRVAIEVNEGIAERLEALDWTQTRLAEEMGVSRSRVSKMLNSDGNVTLRTMVGAALAVGCRLAITVEPWQAVRSSSEVYRAEQKLPDVSAHPKAKGTFAGARSSEFAKTLHYGDRKEGAIGRKRESTSYQTAA